jgi:hypothetical protein
MDFCEKKTILWTNVVWSLLTFCFCWLQLLASGLAIAFAVQAAARTPTPPSLDGLLPLLLSVKHLAVTLLAVSAQAGALLRSVTSVLLANWMLSLPGLLWLTLYWILFQMVGWTPPTPSPPSTSDVDPIGRLQRIPRQLSRRLRAHQTRQARRRPPFGGCYSHGYHKKFPFKLRSPSGYVLSMRRAAKHRFDSAILLDLASKIRKILELLRELTSGEGGQTPAKPAPAKPANEGARRRRRPKPN